MGDSSLDISKPTVLVTGFGPFGIHTVNSSQVAVQELAKMGLSADVNLVTHHIPVEYDVVKETVPGLWKQYKPKLVVHVGVSGIAKELTLEQQAHNDGFDKFDIKGTFPCSKCCVEGAPLCLSSSLNMYQICQEVNESQCGVHSVVSYDPGRYLCDFIYFTSLNIDKTCTAFIHVPPLDKPYSGRHLAESIKIAILAMMQQLQ